MYTQKNALKTNIKKKIQYGNKCENKFTTLA